MEVRATTAENPGGSTAAAQTRAMELSPPTSPPSSPPSATGRQEAELLREASDVLVMCLPHAVRSDATGMKSRCGVCHGRALP